MKNKLLVFMLIITTMTAFTLAQTSILKKKVGTTGQEIKLTFPGNNWIFNQVPVTIDFKWEGPPNVRLFTLYIEYFDNGKWYKETTVPNLQTNHHTYTYKRERNFRWRVTTEYMNRVLHQSVWFHGKYVPGTVIPGGQAVNKTPKFFPVPVAPENGAELTNFPRNMTLRWLHSTKPAFRHYEVQVDILHARSLKWRSKLPGQTYLLEDTTNRNSYSFTFTADRKGRWRVRGMNNQGQYTPWCAWQHFEYRARR